MRPWIALDLETAGEQPLYGLQPWRLRQGKAWITTAAIARRNKTGEIVTDGMIHPTKEWLAAVLQRAIDGGIRIVVWNGVFDMAWLIAMGLGDLVDQVMWIDGMLMWKHLDMTPTHAGREHTYSLKGRDGQKGAVEVFAPEMTGYNADVDYNDGTPEGLAKLLAYDKDDTKVTLIAAERIWDKLEKSETRRSCVLIEAACLPMIARTNVAGMRINRAATKALHIKLSETVSKMEAALAPHGVTEKVIRSPKQLSKKIYDEWGLPATLTREGKRTTSKDALGLLIPLDDRVALLMAYREALNLRGKFIGSIVKSCTYNEDKLTRPQCIPFGTYTSRCTYGSTVGKKGSKAERHIGFPLHQMKRAKEFRALVLAPEEDDLAPEGYEIVEFDAAGQEFRWMAIVSGDPTMLALCEPGEDPHAFMAASIYQGDYRAISAGAKVSGSEDHKKRQGGKVTNLSLQYRTGAATLRTRARTDHGLKLSEEESLHIHRTYPRTYVEVPRYWSRQIQFGQQNGYAETLAGRRLKVVGNWGGPHSYPMQQTMINYPVQGTGGDQKYLALKVLKNHLAKYGARFAWDLHDGMYFFVPKRNALRFALEMRTVLDQLPYAKAWGFSSPIPLTWDCKIGPSWGELVEVKD